MDVINFTRQQLRGRKIGVTADLHIGHANILAYMKRPWLPKDFDLTAIDGRRPNVPKSAVKAHDEAIVTRFNATLSEADILFCVGDVAWWGVPKLQWLRENLLVKEIYFVVGNHDEHSELVEVFGPCVYERLYVSVEGNGGYAHAVLDHYPGYSWFNMRKGAWQLFGHVHGGLNNRHEMNPWWLMSLDVGVDSHNFYPWLWAQELVPLFQSRREQWRTLTACER